MIESPFFIADMDVVLDFLLISLLMVAHVSLRFPSQESILFVKYCRFKRVFREFTLFRTFLYDS